ncbi:LacI family DNA-binding transcriptional regulator [Hoeflea prorocentri]|uniref:LacI family DNA-binding transcriptional regulator n=1 Tax=Hoeflea prorocentri TaxID=1922333 RepID=A0A9X3UFV2_9HYPH|nr:LacI family DNA-binding transcriptional regulator [Hoeflea prorocentri]MCY6379946.1 LacI family DNA-binding transcriptional regulator [Hoeflea prorocentri]MDA5397746.1 LacI family DNA-binding transcriptional regulator [Hoeflea prorocentri]
MRKPLQPKNDRNATSIFDVAREAGVSTASVSRVLNAPNRTKQKTRTAVQEAIKKLGYIPNGAARALSSRNSRVIGAIIPTIDNSIFATGIQALQSYLHTKGYFLLLGSSNYEPELEYELCQNFLVQQVAGIIMMGNTHLPECVQMLKREHTPFVNTGTYDTDGSFCVGFDNSKAAALATKYLVDLGHREFGMIAGIAKDNDRAAQRIEGVRKELSKHGIEMPPRRILERRYEIDEGGAAFRHLMSHPEPPTAIICGNDVLGFGAILEANNSGIDIPRQVSVIGFDDLVLSKHLKPSLSTIQIPTEEMWCRAADTLLARLERLEAPRAIEIDVSLVVRESTGVPPSD